MKIRSDRELRKIALTKELAKLSARQLEIENQLKGIAKSEKRDGAV